MKKIFITGAAGFIGFHLAQHLHRRGDRVVGFDNFNDYYSPKLKKDRADNLAQLGIEVIKGDLCNKEQLSECIEKNSVDAVVNLAAQAGVRYSLLNPQAYIKSNIEGFVNLLEVMRTITPIPLIYASSSSVYGMNEKIPFSILDRTDNQVSLYGATKKTNELLAQTYHHLYGIPVTGLRFFTVYGPWGRPDMAYFSFTEDILKGKPIELFNHGKMKRDFTYIDDIVEGITSAIDLQSSCEIFNLGNNRPAVLEYFIELLEKAIGKKAEKKYAPMQQGDVHETYADIAYSTEKLNFSPKIPLEVGIPRFVHWYLNHFLPK